MKNILLLGKTGFIASHLFLVLSKKHNVKCISHSSINDIEGNFDVVINCCIDPLYRNESYKEENDFDLKAARKFGGRFVMISSRKVYGTSDVLKLYNETSPINPVDHYSENKFTTEQKLRELKSDHLIFRASNVFGFEPGRNSFLGFCIDQLTKNNNITYNLGYKTRRDFVPVQLLCDLIVLSIEKELKGTYNISSNIPYEIGDVASNLIIGYNKDSSFTCTNVNNIKDQFVLDNSKLFDSLGIAMEIDLDSIIQKIGSKL